MTAIFVLLAVAFGAPQDAQADRGHGKGQYRYSRSSDSGYYYSNFRAEQVYMFNGRSFNTFDGLVRYLRVLFDDRTHNRVDTRNDENVSINIETEEATDITDNRATLEGIIDFDDADEATVWFEYGPGSDLKWRTTKVRVFADDDDEAFARELIGLEEGERYSFRAVGEDEDGDREYGSIESFTADEDDNGDDDDSDDTDPTIRTLSAEDMSDDEATLRGEVDMNDFKNGTVFFVYGEDRSMIADVEDDVDTYDDIDEEGDDLQKLLVDDDLDGDASYSPEVSNLDADTTIYFAMGVAYEDEDGDEIIRLGDIRSLTTDN